MSSVANFSQRQWLTILVFAIADFCAACCVSLQSPFYPQGKTFHSYLISLGNDFLDIESSTISLDQIHKVSTGTSIVL